MNLDLFDDYTPTYSLLSSIPVYNTGEHFASMVYKFQILICKGLELEFVTNGFFEKYFPDHKHRDQKSVKVYWTIFRKNCTYLWNFQKNSQVGKTRRNDEAYCKYKQYYQTLEILLKLYHKAVKKMKKPYLFAKQCLNWFSTFSLFIYLFIWDWRDLTIK